MSVLPIIDPEFRAIIPPLSQDERIQLEQNICEKRKCHDPIILWKGVIIDGHNRFEICSKHGIEFQIVEMPFVSREEAKVWIIENQLNRRNLTDVARMEMALLKAEILREKAKKNLSDGGRKGGSKPSTISSKPKIEAIDVRRAAAEEAGVSEGTLNSYSQIKEHGSPELIEKVQSGDIKIGTAHRLLAKEMQKQLTIGGKMINFIRDSMPEEGYKAADPEIHEKLGELSAALDALVDGLKRR